LNKIALAWVLVILVISIALVPHSLVNAKSKDSKAKEKIIKAIGAAVEGRYASIDMVNISKVNDNSTLTVYNKTVVVTPPQPPNPPPPNPPPVINGFKLCMAGDFKDSSVFDAMKKNGCNYRIALGDNGYGSDLSLLKKIAPDKAVCGNHDSKEDGSAAIEKECLVYTGNSWNQKIANSTLILGFNTNGDIPTQLTAAKKLLSDTQFMSGIKNVIAVSHKNGHVFPNAHHPAEAKDLYSQLESSISQGVKLYEVNGHNHNLAQSTDGKWFISGAGGKSHYSCGTDSTWNYCNNSANGYLVFTIDNQGTIAPNFYDTNNKVIH